MNVFFELGIAYATNANLFLLLEKGATREVPTDLAGLTHCRYENRRGLIFDSFAEKDIKNVMKKLIVQKK